MLASDLLKLRRPLVALCFLAVAVLVVLLVWKAQAEAAASFRAATAEGSVCPGECLESIRYFNALASVQQHPVGIGGISAGFSASLPGAFAVFAIASAHVAGEWSRGTMPALVARQPRRARLVLVKYLAVLSFAYALLFGLWAVLAVVALAARASFDIPQGLSWVDPGTFALAQVARASIVLAAYAAVGTISSLLLRSPLAAFGGSVAFLLVSFPLSYVWPLSFSYWIASTMRFEHQQLFQGHVWPVQASGGGSLRQAVAILLLLVPILALVPVARFLLRSEIRQRA